MESLRPSGLPKPRPALTGAHALFCGLVLGAILCAHAFGGVSAGGLRCSDPACHTSLKVDAEGARFVSDERFYPSRERVNVRLAALGRKLAVVGRGGAGGCVTSYAAPGITARVRVCWEGGPLQVSARRNWGGSVMLGVTYRTARETSVPQGVKGIQAGSGTRSPTGGLGLGRPGRGARTEG